MKKASEIKQVKYIKEKNYFSKYSKIEKSRKCCQRHMLFCLMASVSVAGIMSAVVGGSILLYGMLSKDSKNSPQQTYADTCGLTQEEIAKIKSSVDIELIDIIQGYQNSVFERVSPRHAVEKAVYDMWEQLKVNYTEEVSEEHKIRFGHIEKRGCQATQMYLSNIVGDENVFLQMLYDDVNKKVVPSKVQVSQNIRTR